MSLDAIGSIDNANDPKSRAAQIAKLQAYAANVPLVSKKQDGAQEKDKVANPLVSQPETSSFEGLFSYSPALMPSSKTQVPADYPTVERNISSLILDMLPILKAMTNAMKLIGKNQEEVQAAIGNLWQVQSEISKIYTSAIAEAQSQQNAEKEKAIHKIGLFGFISGIFEAVTSIFTGPSMLFDGLIKAGLSFALLVDPDEYDNPGFMSFQKNGLMGIFGKDGEKAQYIFQAVLVLASLGSSLATTGLGKLASTLAEKEILGLGFSLKSAGVQIGKLMDAASVQLSKVGEAVANNFIIKCIIYPFVQFGKFLCYVGELLCTGAGYCAEKAMKACLWLARWAAKALPEDLKKDVVAFFRFCAKALSSDGTKEGNRMVIQKIIGRLTTAYNSVVGKILGMINDLISLIGLASALFKKDSHSEAENSFAQAFLNAMQNGFVGIAAAAPFAIQEAKGQKPNEILQTIFSTGLPLILNQGVMANSLGKHMAQTDTYHAVIAKNMMKFQKFVGNLGAAGSVTSTGNVAFSAVYSEKLSEIKAETDFQQSNYVAQSMLLDNRITNLQGSSGDIQKVIESLAQGVLNFISAISQGIAISNKAVA